MCLPSDAQLIFLSAVLVGASDRQTTRRICTPAAGKGFSRESKEKTDERISRKVVLVGLHAPRLLLFMEPRSRMAPCSFGRTHSSRLLFNSSTFCVFRKQRKPIRLPTHFLQARSIAAFGDLWVYAPVC